MLSLKVPTQLNMGQQTMHLMQELRNGLSAKGFRDIDITSGSDILNLATLVATKFQDQKEDDLRSFLT